MELTAITDNLTNVFQKTFDDTELTLSDDLTAGDVDNWDSLTHMVLIGEIEKEFNIKFKLKELNKMNTVGDLIGMIKSKVS